MKQFGPFELDTVNECLRRDGAQIAIAPKPFAVLRHLVENPGRLITHDELLDALWPETYVQPQVLRTYMLELRKALGDEATSPRFIQTVHKRGYCFVASVSEPGKAPIAESETAGNAGTGASLIGRENDGRQLDEMARLADAGHRQVVFVTGETGIGKTALVNEFCRSVNATQHRLVICGQSVEGLAAKEEYYPFLEALGQLYASGIGEKARGILARIAPGWLPAKSREKGHANGDGIAERHHRPAGELCDALEELAQDRTLVLVLEDMQWADDSTIELVSALARRRAPARLMVVGTYAPLSGTKASQLRTVKQDLLLRRLCFEMKLGPLSRADVARLICARLDQEGVPPELERFLYQRSEGNPLFALAVLERLLSQHALAREKTSGGKWTLSAPLDDLDAGVPEELAQLIELEIERLSVEEQRILEAASLMEIAFPAWAVAAALKQDAGATESACEELARRLWFVHRAGHDDLPNGTRSEFYAFAHGLYRVVLRERQTAARRAEGHVRIAERLRELFDGREEHVAREMANHYEKAGNWHRAASALRVAARDAGQRKAYREAEQLLEHALHIAENLHEDDRGFVLKEVRSELAIAREAIECGSGTSRIV